MNLFPFKAYTLGYANVNTISVKIKKYFRQN